MRFGVRASLRRGLYVLLLLVSCGVVVWAEKDESFSFVVVSDLHIGERNGDEKFKLFLGKVEELNPQPDFIVITGDIHTEAFARLHSEVKPKYLFYVAFGNHESRKDRKILTNLLSLPTLSRDFYSFVHKGVKFIFLCTASSFGDHVGHFESEGIRGSEQQKWFEEELNVDRDSFPLCFVFAHIPPNPKGKAEQMYLSSNDQKALRDIFKGYKPTALFCGHLHRRKEFEIENVRVYILPSINWNFDNEPSGFFVVNVRGTQWEAEFVQMQYSL